MIKKFNHERKIKYKIYKSKLNSVGKTVIQVRLTFLNSRKQFSTGLFIKPKNWNRKQQLVKPPEPDSDYINTTLSFL
ncbi:hypothetical protein KO566_01775 [Flavobacteriaceae bacterium XHP0103]|uniref:Arm DNA-binding domain-containing protein n=1 Tax=Marixanthotalea marina TaxID=2844359 RepID=UPI00384B6D65|nr:hypothetical protein [Marixanthotalea marina]